MSCSWQSRNVAFRRSFSEAHVNLACAGEAETGNGGEQPDQGIAGRNSSRTMRRMWSSRRVLRSGPGPTDGRQSVPARGLVFAPHRTDRFCHALKNARRGPRRVLGSCGNRVVRRESSQMLFDETNPRLTGRSCGAFPGTGRTLPSRHSPRTRVSSNGSSSAGNLTLAPPARS